MGWFPPQRTSLRAFPPCSPTSRATRPGTITYTGANGKVVTVQAMVRQDQDGVGGTTNDCGFSGIAYSGN